MKLNMQEVSGVFINPAEINFKEIYKKKTQ